MTDILAPQRFHAAIERGNAPCCDLVCLPVWLKIVRASRRARKPFRLHPRSRFSTSSDPVNAYNRKGSSGALSETGAPPLRCTRWRRSPCLPAPLCLHFPKSRYPLGKCSYPASPSPHRKCQMSRYTSSSLSLRGSSLRFSRKRARLRHRARRFHLSAILHTRAQAAKKCPFWWMVASESLV